jgi:MbtH protein
MMARTEEIDSYEVLINHEEQYSIWPAHKTIPDGWRSIGFRDTKAVCLHHIEQIWTDMRPLSVRTTSN